MKEFLKSIIIFFMVICSVIVGIFVLVMIPIFIMGNIEGILGIIIAMLVDIIVVSVFLAGITR